MFLFSNVYFISSNHYRVKTKKTLQQHMSDKHFSKPVTCDTCGKKCISKKALTRHKKIHDDRLKERFKCLICLKGFVNAWALKVWFSSIFFIWNTNLLSSCMRLFYQNRSIHTCIVVLVIHMCASFVQSHFDTAHNYQHIEGRCIRKRYSNYSTGRKSECWQPLENFPF